MPTVDHNVSAKFGGNASNNASMINKSRTIRSNAVGVDVTNT